MTNDTKYSGTMSNDTKSVTNSFIGDIKSRITYLATQALDFLMTEDNDYLVIDKSGVMTNDIKH